MKKLALALLLALALCQAAPAFARGQEARPEQGLLDRVSGSGWRAVVDWRAGIIEVVARNRVPRNKETDRDAVEALALEGARKTAYHGLAETLRLVRLSDQGTVAGAADRNRQFQNTLASLVKDARILEEATWPFGQGPIAAKVRLSMPLASPAGLAGPALRLTAAAHPTRELFRPKKSVFPFKLPWQNEEQPKMLGLAPRDSLNSASRSFAPPSASRAAPAPAPPPPAAREENEPGTSYTGLIVVAEGLKARPALFPLVKESGSRRVVYGPTLVNRETAMVAGVVGYAASLNQALKAKRAGAWPLVVKAVGAEGASRCNLLVSYLDAVRIFAADLKSGFIRHGRVIIVLN